MQVTLSLLIRDFALTALCSVSVYVSVPQMHVTILSMSSHQDIPYKLHYLIPTFTP